MESKTVLYAIIAGLALFAIFVVGALWYQQTQLQRLQGSANNVVSGIIGMTEEEVADNLKTQVSKPSTLKLCGCTCQALSSPAGSGSLCLHSYSPYGIIRQCYASTYLAFTTNSSCSSANGRTCFGYLVSDLIPKAGMTTNCK